MIKNIKSKNKGFTLVELIVATSLFIIISAIATGAFIQALKTERNVVALTSALSNVTQSIEQISREVRTGTDFSASDADNLNFKNYKGENVSYRWISAGKVIGRCQGVLCLNATDSDYQPITGDKIAVDSVKFYYQGIGEEGSPTNGADVLPPRITITISVEGIQGSVVHLETSVSPYEPGT